MYKGDEIRIEKPDWCADDLWDYSISLNLSIRNLGYLDVKCNSLNLSVLDNNTLLFKGKPIGVGKIGGYGKFEIKHCKISGLVKIYNQSYVYRIHNLTIEGYAKKGPFYLIPFHIDVNMMFSPLFHIIDFPLYQNKTWGIKNLNITINVNFDFSVSKGKISESYNISPLTVLCKEVENKDDDKTANLSFSSRNISLYSIYSSNAQMFGKLELYSITRARLILF